MRSPLEVTPPRYIYRLWLRGREEDGRRVAPFVMVESEEPTLGGLIHALHTTLVPLWKLGTERLEDEGERRVFRITWRREAALRIDDVRRAAPVDPERTRYVEGAAPPPASREGAPGGTVP